MSRPLDRLFLSHPRAHGESYGEHFAFASSVGLALIAAGFACCLHALLPFLFEDTGSRAIARLHARLSRRSATSRAL